MPLSNKQMEYLALAWQCFDAEPKIDYEKFHQLAGLASVASARELMRVTKKKLKEEYGALGASVASGNAKNSPAKNTAAAVPSTPQSGTKRSRAAKSVGDDDGENEAEHTPAKKAKSASAKKGTAKKANGHVKAEPIADAEDDYILT